MANAQIGSIELLEGNATVVHADGSSEALTANSQILVGDVITAGPGARVQIKLNNGSVHEISAGETVAMADIIEDEGSHMWFIDSGSEAEVAAGFVTNVVGNVIVIRDGEEIVLKVGDFIYAGDILKSGDGTATFRMVDGTDVKLAPNSLADLGSDKFLSQYPDLADILDSSPSDIYKAIIAGMDPSTDLPAPAAGEEAPGGDEGHDTTPDLLVERNESTPDAGHETDNRPNTNPVPEPDLPPLIDDEPSAVANAGGEVTHDETAGDDSDADDVIPAPTSITDVYGTTGLLGGAQSDGPLVSSDGTDFGDDGPGSIVFKLTNSSGGDFTGQDS